MKNHLDVSKGLRIGFVLFAYLTSFVALDWLTRSFQVFPGVVPWYPPDGISFALLLALGARFAPVVGVASLISSLFIYQLDLPPQELFGWAIFLSIAFGIASSILRRRIHIDLQLKSLRDVLWLIVSAVFIALTLAVVSVSAEAASGTLSTTDRVSATFQWWVGEMIGILVITPMLLIYVMPWVKGVVEGGWNVSWKQMSRPRAPKHMLGRGLTLLVTLYLAFGEPNLRPFHPYYLVAIPLLWLALDYGIKGIVLGIPLVSFVTIFLAGALKFSATEISELQLLIMVISTIGLVVGAVRTEQIQAEAGLRDNEKRFKAMIENSADAITLLDAQGRASYDSPAAPGMLGYAQDELMGRQVFDLIHPDDLHETQVLFQDLVKISGARISHTLRFLHKDGSWRWLEAVTTNLLNESAVKAIVVNYRDVTERKLAEDALQQAKDFAENVIQTANVIFLQLDIDGRVQKLNTAAEEITGYRRAEVEGTNWFEALAPRDRYPHVWEEFQRITSPGEAPKIFENPVLTRDGRERYILWKNNVLSTNGEITGTISFGVDITERKQAEEWLRSSEDRYRDLVNSSQDLICTHDLEGRILSVNPHAEQVLGYPPGSLLQMNLRDILLPETQKYFRRYLSGIRAHGMVEGVMHIRTANGEPRLWEYRNTLRTQGVTEPIVRGMARDVTEQRKAEEAVRAAELKYRSIFENSVEGIYQTSPEGSFITANPALARMFGYDSAQEFIAAFTDPDCEFYVAANRRRDFIEGVESQNFIDGFESEVYRKDGSIIWISENARAVRDHDGTLLLYEGSIENITSRKQAEQQILSLSKFPSENPNPVLRLEPNGKVLYANRASTVFLDSWAQQIGETVPAGLRDYAVEAYVLDQNKEIELQLEGKTFAFMLTPIKDAGYTNVYGRDITERKEAEAELSRLYELSRSLAMADNLDDILGLVNRHAVECIHTTFARIALLEGDYFVIRSAYPVRPLDHDLEVGSRFPLSSMPYCEFVLEGEVPVLLTSHDLQMNPKERKALFLEFAESLCLIPLRVGGSTADPRNATGLLMLGEARNQSREPFTPDKLRLAQSIADQAAVAIRRVLLHRETRRGLEHLTALREIDQAISGTFSLKLSLMTVLTKVTEQLEVDAATVWIFDPVSKNLRLSMARGFHSRIFEQAKPLRLGEGHAGRAALERCSISIPDLMEGNDNRRLMRGLQADPFVSYFAVPLIAKGQIKGVLEVFHRSRLEPDEEWISFLHTLAGQTAIAVDNATLFEDLQYSNHELGIAYDATIEGWSHALDLRDKETEGHTQRVTDLTLQLAKLFGFDEHDLLHIRRGALLHDIGKMGVPDGILLKPGALTDEEWVSMRKHPQFAYDMLSPIKYLRKALDIPYCHHEKWDGTGYPRGLKGEQIPLTARIFALVDVWDALTSDRPYRPAWPEEKVIQHIKSLSGTHFDPRVVEVCLDFGPLSNQRDTDQVERL